MMDIRYQGELDKDGLRDGRGISLEPGSVLVIGRFKKDQNHGYCTWITHKGEVSNAIYSDGGIL